MDFETTINTIREYFSLTNVRIYDFYYGLDIGSVKHFFDVETKTLERQMKEDIVITQDKINSQWFRDKLFSFLDHTKRIIYEKSHPEDFRKFAIQIFYFLGNWITLLDENCEDLKKLKMEIQQRINELKKQVELWYSIYDLIVEQNRQRVNLQKWNSFRPAGYDVAPHMLKILLDKEEDKNN